VPAGSKIASIEEIDQPGLCILVPQRSAQEAHLRKTITKTTPINVAVENPKQAVELIAAGQADAFSREVPMLASTQPSLPGSRVLPRSYFSVPSPSRRPRTARPPSTKRRAASSRRPRRPASCSRRSRGWSTGRVVAAPR
jgi:hypothetical protein